MKVLHLQHGGGGPGGRFPRTWAHGRHLAFSLIELLVVIAIIGLLAAIGMPALKGFGKGNAMNASVRQVLDDLAMARRAAINGRTTVYMVFLSTNWLNQLNVEPDPRVRRILTNLFDAPLSAYALVSARTVGDQPGQARMRYLTEWKRLPEGVLFDPVKFGLRQLGQVRYDTAVTPFKTGRGNVTTSLPLPFPANPLPEVSTRFVSGLHHLEFNARGQSVDETGQPQDVVIPLVPGTVFPFKNAQGVPRTFDVQSKSGATGTRLVVRGTTGRAQAETLKLP